MALLFMDGFDHYGTAVPSASDMQKWASHGNSPNCTTTSPRTGTGCLNLDSSSDSMTSKTYTTSGGAIVGVAINITSRAAGDIVSIMESSTVHVALSITVGGLLQIKRGSTVIATGTTVLATGSWYYLELKTVIHDSAGTYEVKIDTVSEAALTATGADTQNGGTGVWNCIKLGSNVDTCRLDDLYLCDTSGSAPRNTFLGAVKIDTLYPQTDAVAVGSNTGLTPSTGTDHGALVDEATPNTTDYNSSPTVGLKDTYNYPAMTLSGTVLGVQTNLYIQKSDATARTVCAVARTASTDSDGASISPSTTFGYQSTVWQQDPNVGSPIEWTVANINSAQFGMKVTS